MKMNVKLLRKIKKHILANPRRFYMEEAVLVGKPGEMVAEWMGDQTFPECGTTACIAGWACILSGSDPKRLSRNLWPTINKKAAELIGIEINQNTDYLFRNEYWPRRFSDAFDDAKTEEERANIAADRIEHFIATKGAE